MSLVIDLDAERREIQYPDGIDVRLRGHVFRFPSELPAEALDSLLSDELDLVGLLADLAKSAGGTAVGDTIELLFKRPTLPKRFLAAVKDTFRVLLGEEPFERFLSVQPSISDYVRLTKALARVYGIELGKSFGLGASSATSGGTSSPTSPDTTTSTPDSSGADPDSPASSGSAG
ncbi:hypothetical protein [Streptomyces sp. MBT27]|uniref:hypothetical protein n=1 Tax=Streptomyces sp. MBT27 TaxID=1488356 RepID=UPI0014232A16|nr:hypothetical protein [Streptomyces sp. MBT27]